LASLTLGPQTSENLFTGAEIVKMPKVDVGQLGAAILTD